MPFVRAGIPAVELISFDYGPFNIFWHTALDTVGKWRAVGLGIVGRVLFDALDDLESGRKPKPLVGFLECCSARRRTAPSFAGRKRSPTSVRALLQPRRTRLLDAPARTS